jgi:hypothetical protein
VEPSSFNLRELIRRVVNDTQGKAGKKNLTVHRDNIDDI